jgi:hypothetical protein
VVAPVEVPVVELPVSDDVEVDDDRVVLFVVVVRRVVVSARAEEVVARDRLVVESEEDVSSVVVAVVLVEFGRDVDVVGSVAVAAARTVDADVVSGRSV